MTTELNCTGLFVCSTLGQTAISVDAGLTVEFAWDHCDSIWHQEIGIGENISKKTEECLLIVGLSNS